jgi:orotate phosphoribosyltransferase
VTLSARPPGPFLDALRRIRRGGYDVLHVAIGVDRAAHRRSAADAGVPARVAELAPSWREADALVIAS